MNFYTGETGKEYYEMRQARRSDFLQKRRASHFQPHIKGTDTVLDFGCGTGGILENLTCAEKLGIEVNQQSIKEATEKGLTVHLDFSNIADNSIDVVISNHALEHVPNPAEQMSEIKRVLKPQGKTILVVPAENPSSGRFNNWQQDDPDQHIYSWTPLSFGNFIGQSGLSIDKAFRRPIGYSKYIEPLAGINEMLFQLARKIMAFLLQRYEVVCVAHKN